jgi:tRNA U34 5-methylaminomethyl-2-thiouridine-forming methyltransferase MnmC
MPNLIPISGDKKPLTTGDGSVSFYNLTYQQGYHAKSIGAFTESLHKFVIPSGICEKMRKGNVRLLDICLGIGANLSVTFYELEKLGSPKEHRLQIVSLEKDHSLVHLIQNTALLSPPDGYKTLRKLLYEGTSDRYGLDVMYGDAVNSLKKLNAPFDIIYFDPFSKRANPEMWTEDVFRDLYRILSDDGIVVTYSSARGVRNDMQKVGFKVSDITRLPTGFQTGTIAVKY